MYFIFFKITFYRALDMILTLSGPILMYLLQQNFSQRLGHIIHRRKTFILNKKRTQNLRNKIEPQLVHSEKYKD